MFKNDIRLPILFLILALGIMLCILGAGAQFLDDFLQHGLQSGNNDRSTLQTSIILLTIGIIGFLSSIGMLFNRKWARIALTFLMLAIALGWTVLIGILLIDNANADSDSPMYVLIGFSTFIYSLCFFSIFFLNNNKFLNEMGETVHDDSYSSILDK